MLAGGGARASILDGFGSSSREEHVVHALPCEGVVFGGSGAGHVCGSSWGHMVILILNVN